MTTESVDPTFDNLLNYLLETRGFDFTGYKPTSLQRRIQKRMATVSVQSFDDYVDYLQADPQEYDALFNTILINVTAFFRDKPAWDYLRDEIIPQIVLGKNTGDEIRVWSAGCASGEEPYSIAILLAEALGDDLFRSRVKIYATDVDEEALAQARHAHYTQSALEDMDADLRSRYFVETAGGAMFRSDLRRQLIFGRHDLVQDAPISRLDLLICRNTLMYLNADTQTDILHRLHFAMRDDGYLFLGKAEMMLTRTNLFLPTDLKFRVFTKVRRTFPRTRSYAPPRSREENPHTLDMQLQLGEGALDAVDQAALVVDRQGILLMANQTLRTMFELDPRDLGRPLQDLEISYRPVELRSLIDRVNETRKPEIVKNIERAFPNGEVQNLEVKVVPLPIEGHTPLGTAVIFTDVSRYHRLQSDLERVNQDMETTNEELQSSNEELETTNEELQSTNEELETTNEELQSTNEELETMNEELQSTNEELETLNNELQQHSQDIADSNAFLNAILASIDSGVVVVDRQMQVLSWNQAAMELWGLRSDEVRGASLLTLDIGLPVAQLTEPVLACINGVQAVTVIAVQAINRRGRHFQCRVQLSPLFSGDNSIIGVIMLMDEMGVNRHE